MNRTKLQVGREELVQNEQLEFEKLFPELSARFVNVPAKDVDAEINDALTLIGQCLDLDIVVVWESSDENPDILVMTHLYRPGGGPPVPERMDSSQYFPWNLAQSLDRKTVVISSLEDIPEEAKVCDLASWRHFNIKSLLNIPLSVGGETPFGIIGFCTTIAERSWPEPLQQSLQIISQVFANALVRKRYEEALIEKSERLTLATSAANTGLWILNAQGTRFWANEKALELFGLPPNDSLGMDHFFALTHPDDRQQLQETIQHALQSHDITTCEYRIIRPDGQVRWLVSLGRMYSSGNGNHNKFMGITSDITTRKLMEEKLRANEFRLESAVDLAMLGLYEEEGLSEARISHPDGRTRDLLGIPPDLSNDQMRGYWFAHVHPDDQPNVIEWIHEFENPHGKDHLTLEYRIVEDNRGVKWLRHIVHALSRDTEGYVVKLIGIFQDMTEQKTNEENLKQALAEVKQLRDQLQNENVYLREQIRSASGHSTILGESEPIQRMLTLGRKVAATDCAVLITGETGTGKELLAEAIHNMSSRKARTMVKVNCAALPAPLIESELFGREKGAYTGAMTQQAGRFELANKSTIFLDEIGELPLDIQVKLLRVLQDGQFERLGGHHTLTTDIRIIAATNRDLNAMVRAGTFREDLFHRLNVFPIEAPPLRARVGDIPLLVWKIVQEFNKKIGRSIDSIPKATMERLQQHPWPGNVRELRNVVERAMILSEGRTLKIVFPETEHHGSNLPTTLEEAERTHVLAALETAHWRISGKGGAAEILGLIPTTLHSLMKRLEISRPKL